jgi:hypothetical protein
MVKGKTGRRNSREVQVKGQGIKTQQAGGESKAVTEKVIYVTFGAGVAPT